jgi:hypothetical protein
MPRIIVQRMPRLRLTNAMASVFVDGQKCAVLPVDSSTDFLVTVGSHVISMRIGFTTAPETRFYAADHETINFVCVESGLLRPRTHLKEMFRVIPRQRFIT